MENEFMEIRGRLTDTKSPLGYYYAEDKEYYPLGCDEKSAKWETIDENRSFSVWRDSYEMKIRIKCLPDDNFSACFEYALFCPECMFAYSAKKGGIVHGEVSSSSNAGLSLGPNVLSHQSVYGDGIAEELSNYSVASTLGDNGAEHVFSSKIPSEKWNGKCAIKLALRVGNKIWKQDDDPIRTLGKSDVSPDDFGFLLPICK
jgi:hypothetical protein